MMASCTDHGGYTVGLHRPNPVALEKPYFIGFFASQLSLAEREGFEPPIGLHLCRISSAVHSTTLPPLQAPRRVIPRPAVGASSRRGRLGRQGAGPRNPWRLRKAKRSPKWSI